MRAKVFGIGLNKTGTTSLGLAFQALGYRHFKRSPAVFAAWKRRDFAGIFAAIEGYDSFEDWPWPLMVHELIERYPDAKFVLTRRRSVEVWLTSISRHALRTHPTRNPREAVFGARYPQGNEQVYARKYEEHLRDTCALFATLERQEQLAELCWEEGDGWSELCDFLGESVPDAAFPRVNVSAEVEIPAERLAANLAAIGALSAK